MSVEMGAPPLPENTNSDKKKDSSEEKKGFLPGFLRRREEETAPPPPPPEMLFDKKEKKDDEEEDVFAPLRKILDGKYKDEVALEAVEPEEKTEKEVKPAEEIEETNSVEGELTPIEALQDQEKIPLIDENTQEMDVEQAELQIENTDEADNENDLSAEATGEEPEEKPKRMERVPKQPEASLEGEGEEPETEEPITPVGPPPVPPPINLPPTPDATPPEPEAVPPLPPIVEADPVSSGVPVPEAQTSAVINSGGNSGRAADALLGMGLLYEHHRTTKKSRESEKRDKDQQEQLDALKKEQHADHVSSEALRNLAEHQAMLQTQEQASHKAPAPEQAGIDKAIEKTAANVVSDQAVEAQTEQSTKQEPIPSIGELIAERNLPSKSTPEKTNDEDRKITHVDPREVLRPDLKEKDSEILLQQIEAAAEQDVALEAQYELRHEVKDVASGGSDTKGGSLTGIASTTRSATDTSQLFMPDSGSKARAHELPTENQASEVYRQAVWAGLWGAGIVLIALAIWAIST